MFSGIIEEVGKVAGRRFSGGAIRLEIRSLRLGPEVKPGESVAVNGACLTVEKKKGRLFEVSLSPQTQKETTLGKIRPGEPVNLERALKLGDRIGGHFLLGHIDFFCPLKTLEHKGNAVFLQIKIPAEFEKYIIRRGSIGIDGISLTIGEIEKGVTSVWLIPYTLENTNLKYKKPNQAVNVEIDYLTRCVDLLKSGKRYVGECEMGKE